MEMNYQEAGDEARDNESWSVAADHYKKHVSENKGDFAIWVQLGHALKESGRYGEAENAYRTALVLQPNDADLLLQVGHLMKILHRKPEAIEFYYNALRQNTSSDAYNELNLLGFGTKAKALIEQMPAYQRIGKHLFQINDLIYFLREHKTPSGIQRVQLGIVTFVLARPEMWETTVFVFNFVGSFELRRIQVKKLAKIVDYLEQPIVEQKELRTLLDELMAQSEIIQERSGDIFVILGAFWSLPNNTALLAKLKRSKVTLGLLFYDLIPVTHPEYCVSQLNIDFSMDMTEALVLIDFAISISEHTDKDLREFMNKRSMKPLPTQVVPLAHTLTSSPVYLQLGADVDHWTEQTSFLRDRDFVICVCTIEPRKNHQYLFLIWKALCQRNSEVPYLVFVGRRGWKTESFFAQLESSNFLDGKIIVVHDLSDTQLSTLYRRCLFSVFPSIVEGWGLPVGESLSHGKLCVASDASSMPEVGGSFPIYIDPLNTRHGIEVINLLIQDKIELQRREKEIRASFKPRNWIEVSEDFCAAVKSLADKVLVDDIPSPALTPGKMIKVGRFSRGPHRLSFEEMTTLVRLAFADDFYEPEPFGAWMKGYRGELRIVTGLEKGTNVLVFLELFGAPDVGSLRVKISERDEYKSIQVSNHFYKVCRIRAKVNEKGFVMVRFEVVDTFDEVRHLPRVFGLGLVSFGYAREANYAERAELHEAYMFDRDDR